MMRLDLILCSLLLLQISNGVFSESKLSNRILLEASMDKIALLNLSDSFAFKFIDTIETKSRRYFILDIASNKIKVDIYVFKKLETFD